MKKITMGMLALTMICTAFAADTKKPAKKAKAKTECAPANCKDSKNCKDPKDCKGKNSAKTCTPSCKGK